MYEGTLILETLKEHRDGTQKIPNNRNSKDEICLTPAPNEPLNSLLLLAPKLSRGSPSAVQWKIFVVTGFYLGFLYE